MKLFVSPRMHRLIDMALEEDEVGYDVTSQVFFEGERGEARLVAKQPLVVAGMEMVRAVYAHIDPTVHCTFAAADGQALEPGEVLGCIEGDAVSILRGERVALNFLQHTCGVATLTRAFVQALAGSNTQVVDTRKTLPGFRELDKYAVRCAGAGNHRFNLAGGVLIKDNHIAQAGGVPQAMDRIRAAAPHSLRVEVEVTSLAQLDQALDAGADIVMLDNMDTPTMQQAVARTRAHHRGQQVLIEASGNMSLARLPELRELGLDLVSVGALTHSAPAADISMRMAHRAAPM